MPQNRHTIFIAAPADEVFKQALLWGEAKWWPKHSLMQFIRRSGEEIKIGTIYRQKVKLPFGPQWEVAINEIVPVQRVSRNFLNGIFKGREMVLVIPQTFGCQVDYVLDYEINGKINKLLWKIFFQRLHDENLKLILESMREYILKEVRQ
ncbi:MAG: hypothetical protein ACOY3D_00735 [Candidatus Omnitrophota bacterium]